MGILSASLRMGDALLSVERSGRGPSASAHGEARRAPRCGAARSGEGLAARLELGSETMRRCWRIGPRALHTSLCKERVRSLPFDAVMGWAGGRERVPREEEGTGRKKNTPGTDEGARSSSAFVRASMSHACRYEMAQRASIIGRRCRPVDGPLKTLRRITESGANRVGVSSEERTPPQVCGPPRAPYAETAAVPTGRHCAQAWASASAQGARDLLAGGAKEAGGRLLNGTERPGRTSAVAHLFTGCNRPNG